MKAVLSADWVKMRRSWIWAWILLVPGAVLGLSILVLWYFSQTDTAATKGWMVTLELLHHLLELILFLSVPLLAGWLAQMEYQSGMWKQSLAMPLARWKLYTAKFLWCAGLTQIAGILLMFSLYGIGRLWKVEQAETLPDLLIYVYFPFFLAIPYVALYTWMTSVFENQTVPISVGVAGIFLGPLFKGWGWWTPWGFLSTYMPDLVGADPAPIIWGMGLALGALWFFIGLIHFNRKDF